MCTCARAPRLCKLDAGGASASIEHYHALVARAAPNADCSRFVAGHNHHVRQHRVFNSASRYLPHALQWPPNDVHCTIHAAREVDQQESVAAVHLGVKKA